MSPMSYAIKKESSAVRKSCGAIWSMFKSKKSDVEPQSNQFTKRLMANQQRER